MSDSSVNCYFVENCNEEAKRWLLSNSSMQSGGMQSRGRCEWQTVCYDLGRRGRQLVEETGEVEKMVRKVGLKVGDVVVFEEHVFMGLLVEEGRLEQHETNKDNIDRRERSKIGGGRGGFGDAFIVSQLPDEMADKTTGKYVLPQQQKWSGKPFVLCRCNDENDDYLFVRKEVTCCLSDATSFYDTLITQQPTVTLQLLSHDRFLQRIMTPECSGGGEFVCTINFCGSSQCVESFLVERQLPNGEKETEEFDFSMCTFSRIQDRFAHHGLPQVVILLTLRCSGTSPVLPDLPGRWHAERAGGRMEGDVSLRMIKLVGPESEAEEVLEKMQTRYGEEGFECEGQIHPKKKNQK
eukprot:GHVS01025118.1.p1 GENE.GHVS01025118.1~~GHVS01025118.1.p1  ORF type:complete len:352 (+),score=61.48 GHVS01025118.1:344-1399(+)